MFRGRRIAVVVPALNEADKVARTIRSVPGFVDHVIVVDDGSSDATARIGRRTGRRGLDVIVHGSNRGVGAAIATGYARAVELGADVTAVMAGDAQMDPLDLPRLLAPVVAGDADYAKGNRFLHPDCRRVMPRVRFFGNVVLSWLTQRAVGCPGVFDSQCGYTAASRWALGTIDPATMFPRYGYPNAVLARLVEHGARIADVAVRPVYGPSWRSGIKIARVAPAILALLGRTFFRRLSRGVLRALGLPASPSLDRFGRAPWSPVS